MRSATPESRLEPGLGAFVAVAVLFAGAPSAHAISYGEPQFAAGEVLAAIARAYPAQVDTVSWRDGDWATQVRGTWFYWEG